MISAAARDQDSSSRPRSLNKGPEGRGNSMKRPRCFPACIALIPKSWHGAVTRFAHPYRCVLTDESCRTLTDNEGGRDLPGRISQLSLRVRRAKDCRNEPARYSLSPFLWDCGACNRLASIADHAGVTRFPVRLRRHSDLCSGVISRRARNWPDEKLYQNSVFDFGGGDLQCWFCSRASELQENRQELPHER